MIWHPPMRRSKEKVSTKPGLLVCYCGLRFLSGFSWLELNGVVSCQVSPFKLSNFQFCFRLSDSGSLQVWKGATAALEGGFTSCEARTKDSSNVFTQCPCLLGVSINYTHLQRAPRWPRLICIVSIRSESVSFFFPFCKLNSSSGSVVV